MGKKIYIDTDDEKYQYDIHSLFKAFYSNDEVSINVGDQDSRQKDHFRINTKDGTVIYDEYKDGALLYRQTETAKGVDTSSYRNIIKRLIYNNLSKKLNKELPWGTLTGIRPIKLFMNRLDEGLGDEIIMEEIKRSYLVSGERLSLGLEIAKRERDILDHLSGAKGYSLYIGIPFCPTTCMYCSFTSFPISAFRDLADEYIKALKKEIDYTQKANAENKKILDTVYIGGGTPTTLEPCQLEDIIGYLREKLDMSSVKEFTVEAGRPDSITKEKLDVLKKMGVTRISINPQTMNEKTLKIIGRAHTERQVHEAFYLAREAGFDNINTDLIIGLPGEGTDELEYTFDEIRGLNPESLTVHSMAVKRAARMHEYLSAHPEIKSENTPEMIDLSERRAREMGLLPYYLYRQKNMAGNYENTGYALKGHYGLYNILIMEEVQSIVALGAGTVTKRVYADENGNKTGLIERCDNVKDVKLYIEKIDEMIERKRRLFDSAGS